MYHRPVRAGGRKVMLATPVYGDLSASYTFALFHSSAALSDAGIAAELAIYEGDCHVDDARNRLVRDFLETDCSDLVFLDSDLRWEPESLVQLCRYDRDVVAATYPFKQDERGFPVAFKGGEMWAHHDGLLEVLAVPTGFLRIRRRVLEKLATRATKFRPKSDARSDIPLIFEREVEDGLRRGGDYAFCRKWREIGGQIFVAPEMYLEHFGSQVWSGSLGHYRREETKGTLGACIFEIRHRIETPETFNRLVEAWGNEHYVAGPSMLHTAVILARQTDGPVLECGSGLTTLVLAAAGARVYTLEHEQEWAHRVNQAAVKYRLSVRVSCNPLVDNWYQIPAIWPKDFELAVCDGPPRGIGNRSLLFERATLWGPLIADDAEQPFLGALESFADESGRKVEVVGEGKRKFAIAA
ncbi:MAG: hypothetical protein ACR2RF_00300 [Geminicoccaceae bacterium]